MIELIGIISCLLIFLIFSLFPLPVGFASKFLNNYKFYKYDFLLINLLINFVLLLFLSFTEINLFYYFISLICLSLIINSYSLFINKFNLKNLKDINFLFFITINLIIFIFIASEPTLSWDSQKNWFYKAQGFFYNYNFFDLDKTLGVDYYPHLGTYLWGFFWKNSLLGHEYSGRFIFVFIFLLSIFSICDHLNVKKYIKALIVSLILLLCFDNFLFKGYQEVLIFSLMLFASKNIYNYILYKKNLYLITSFMCFNLLPWVKNEGYLLLLIFIFSLLVTIKKFPKKKDIILFICFSTLLIIIKKLIFLNYLDINLTHGGNLSLAFNFFDFVNFLITIFVGTVVAIFKYKIWIFIFLSIFLISKNKKINHKDNQFINLLKINLIMYFLLILGIYFSVSDHIYGIEWWIDNSLDRILYQISGLFIMYIVLSINYFKIKL